MFFSQHYIWQILSGTVNFASEDRNLSSEGNCYCQSEEKCLSSEGKFCQLQFAPTAVIHDVPDPSKIRRTFVFEQRKSWPGSLWRDAWGSKWRGMCIGAKKPPCCCQASADLRLGGAKEKSSLSKHEASKSARMSNFCKRRGWPAKKGCP